MILSHLRAKARPPPGVSVAKQSEVNDEPIKSKLASFIMGQRRPRIVLLSRRCPVTWVVARF